MALWRQIVFQKVANLSLVQSMCLPLTDTKLERVEAVLLGCLDLDNLASIDLDHGARYNSAPLVPEVRHAHLVAKQTDTPSIAACRLR